MTLLSKVVNRINAYRGITPSVEALYQSVKQYLPRNPTIIEAGAHMGFDTIGLAKIWPKGFVYGFEPIPDIYQALINRVHSQPNVKTYNVALGESSAVIPMYVSSGQSNASSSVLKPSKHLELFPEVSFNNTVDVSMTTLQDWSITENISVIDLIWLDMQGYEVNALKGAGNLLKDIRVIYTELCRDELYQGLITRDSYIQFLKSAGFDLISVIHDEDAVSDGIFINRTKMR